MDWGSVFCPSPVVTIYSHGNSLFTSLFQPDFNTLVIFSKRKFNQAKNSTKHKKKLFIRSVYNGGNMKTEDKMQTTDYVLTESSHRFHHGKLTVNRLNGNVI